MSEPHAQPEPYDHGRLAVAGRHATFWETVANPNGKPTFVLHGGPGCGPSPRFRRPSGPTRHRTRLFHKRNCGRATANAAEREGGAQA